MEVRGQRSEVSQRIEDTFFRRYKISYFGSLSAMNTAWRCQDSLDMTVQENGQGGGGVEETLNI
jgi:hypothetical protein